MESMLVLLAVFETRSPCVAIRAGLKLPAILLREPPTCRDYRCEPSGQAVFIWGCVSLRYWEPNPRPLSLNYIPIYAPFTLRQDPSRSPRLASLSQSSCLNLAVGDFRMKEEELSGIRDRALT